MPLSDFQRDYIREYKQKKYEEDPAKERGYQSSLKLKKKYEVSPEVWEKYKHHLIDAFNFSKLVKRLPAEMVYDLLAEPLELE